MSSKNKKKTHEVHDDQVKKEFESVDEVEKDLQEENKQDDVVETNEAKTEDGNVSCNHDEEIKKLKEEIATLKDEIVHQVAKSRNANDRHEKEVKEIRKYNAKSLGEKIIPDIEILKKVINSGKNASDDVKRYLQGFEMIVTKLNNSLEEVGIVEFVVKQGSMFDENKESAIDTIETNEFAPGTVVEVVSNGYMIHDRVLEHAKVKVAAKPIEVKEENKEEE